MKKPKNKANLLNYIALSLAANSCVIPDNTVFILGGMMQNPGETMILTNRKQNYTTDLACENHEEADTRLFAHLFYCSKEYGHKRAVIQATDTDVIMLSMYHFALLETVSEIWIEKGDKFLPIHDLVRYLSRKYKKDQMKLAGTLLCTYVFSGCDSVSYPYRLVRKELHRLDLK